MSHIRGDSHAADFAATENDFNTSDWGCYIDEDRISASSIPMNETSSATNSVPCDPPPPPLERGRWGGGGAIHE